MANYGLQAKESLCVNCARICMGDLEKGCSWSADLTPVEGWDATGVYGPDGQFYTYRVNRCPRFIRGIYRPLFEKEGVILVLEKALRLARKDYIHGDKVQRAECLRFIRKFVPDCDRAVAIMKREARKFDMMKAEEDDD